MDLNNLTDVEYELELEKFVWPDILEWISIPIFTCLLIVGLVGNFLVIFVVFRNESMRTITNFFLVNLAFADFLVLLFCLPFTVLWDITNTWWFGTAMCKIIVYLQTVSVSVSVITLTCISVERWYAICNPLSFKSTLERTRTALIITWLISLSLSMPELVVLNAQPFPFKRENLTLPFGPSTLALCTDSWGEKYQTVYQFCQTVVLYFFPLILMGCMYGQIAYVLWVKSVPPSDPCLSTHKTSTVANVRKASAVNSPKTSTIVMNAHKASTVTNGSEGRRCRSSTVNDPGLGRKQKNSTTSEAGSGYWANNKTRPYNLDHSKEKEIFNRRKAAKMLIAVVVLFAVCYFPTHFVNILKQFDLFTIQSTALNLFAMRFLCYFNSCINPLIYNFMSEKFQREFRRACCCFPSKFRTGSASRFSTFAGENATLLAPSRRMEEKSQSFVVIQG